MQTFLPYPDFVKCAQVLDNKRLNKQHLECFQIINVLEGRSHAWKNHPAVRMWKGYETALKYYANCMKEQCLVRGFKSEKIPYYQITEKVIYPYWFNENLIYISHQSNLMRKDSVFYSKYGFIDYGISGYFWPVQPKTKKCQLDNFKWIALSKELKGDKRWQITL